MEDLFHVRQASLLALRHPCGRDAGGPGDDLSDLLLTDDRLGRRGLRRPVIRVLGGLDPCGEFSDLIAHTSGAFVVLGLDRRLLLGLEFGEIALERVDVDTGSACQRHPGTGLVDEVDGLVRQEAVGDVAVRQFDRGPDRLVGVGDFVEFRVAILQSLEDRHGVLHTRFAHGHRLEPAFERRVLLDGAVLLERGGTDHVQIAAGQSRLEDVSGIHRIRLAAAACPDEGVEFVDEDDHVSVLGDLIQRPGQPLLEVSAVAGAREHAGHIEGDDALAVQLLGHLTGVDGLGQALGDRGLADACLTEQNGVVLRPAGEDLDRLLDLLGPTDDRVEAALCGQRREVGAVLLEHGSLGLVPFGLLPGLHSGLGGLRSRLQGCLCHPGLSEDASGRHLLIEHEGEEDVLRIDVGRPEGTCHLVGVEQGPLGGTGQRGCGVRRDVGGRRKALFDAVGDGFGIGARLAHGRDPGFGIDHDAQDVQGVDLGLTVTAGEFRGRFDDLVAALAQQPVDVDGTASARSVLPLQKPCEELIEGVTARACGSIECGQN